MRQPASACRQKLNNTDIIPKNWHPKLGDRRQELVFIGIDLDRKAITDALRICEVDFIQD